MDQSGQHITFSKGLFKYKFVWYSTITVYRAFVTWQDLCRTDGFILVQYIACFKVSLVLYDQDDADSGDTNLLLLTLEVCWG